jgi:endoglucanase
MLQCKIVVRRRLGMFTRSRRDFIQHGALAVALGASHSVTTLGEARSVRGGSQATFRLGVNLAGAEFEAIGNRWGWPGLTNLDYYLDKGFNAFRVPFRWERLQPELQGPLLDSALEGLDGLVTAMNARGAVAILDAHNYGRREKQIIGVDGSGVTTDDFADFWGRMGERYRSRSLVWYNLMNEPHDMPDAANLDAQNAACSAIRRAGASSKVLFSGNAWTGGHSWLKSRNSQVMLDAHDPANNYAFDIHQYLNVGFGGSGKAPVVPGAGSTTLQGVTAWARANGKKLFLGEFGCGPAKDFLTELDALLATVISNRDVFVGATYFAGGGSWGKNLGSTDPVDGVEKPQTRLLERYLERTR